VGGSQSKDTAADYRWAQPAGGLSALPFACPTSARTHCRPGRFRAKDGRRPIELHAWCLLVLAWIFVPFYARAMVFTMPEFLERRFSTQSRYVLTIVSLLTFIVSKIAVGIFAGGVVFATLLPELKITLGSVVIDSFWVGSVIVIALTGATPWSAACQAYNDAVQVTVLITGSALLTLPARTWVSELKRICGSDMFNL
jgi:SSS family solute:Na+ symporter